eukprot:16434683-Heterocapsa_arctica.AAC.1
MPSNRYEVGVVDLAVLDGVKEAQARPWRPAGRAAAAAASPWSARDEPNQPLELPAEASWPAT